MVDLLRKIATCYSLRLTASLYTSYSMSLRALALSQSELLVGSGCAEMETRSGLEFLVMLLTLQVSS